MNGDPFCLKPCRFERDIVAIGPRVASSAFWFVGSCVTLVCSVAANSAVVVCFLVISPFSVFVSFS